MMRIGNPNFRSRWVDDTNARDVCKTVEQWREKNPDATSAEIREAARQGLEDLTGETWSDDYEVMLAVLDLDIAKPTELRKWFVHHFWTAIPVDRRRGEQPVEGVDFGG